MYPPNDNYYGGYPPQDTTDRSMGGGYNGYPPQDTTDHSMGGGYNGYPPQNGDRAGPSVTVSAGPNARPNNYSDINNPSVGAGNKRFSMPVLFSLGSLAVLLFQDSVVVAAAILLQLTEAATAADILLYLADTLQGPADSRVGLVGSKVDSVEDPAVLMAMVENLVPLTTALTLR
ncbi:hypothetical protein LPJ66_003451 [Kickxella alabastrina]|uniref:Uncharacterized protein n=1 Tax=Kickxella alabastrina TaxID=61397 RepID=A0ACC1IKM9_9FUNG|nr:hypothetical protein LPJ66_003451 [Kickxella alabastrina]